MARASGHLVMTGHKDKEYSMAIEFSDGIMPHQLRKEGYYLGLKSYTAMIEVISKLSGLQSTGASTGVEEHKPDISIGDRATASTDELRNVESQCSTKSSKEATPGSNSPRAAMDFLEEVPEDEVSEEGVPAEEVPEVPERSQPVACLPLQVRPGTKKHFRSVGRAPDFLSRDFSDEEDEVEITEVDEYTIFTDDQSSTISLCVLPLEFEDQELIASRGSVSTSEVSLLGKSRGSDVMRSITAWKLTFFEHGSFHILVKITQTSGAKRWVKLGKPRPGYKETVEDVFCVAKFLAFLKKEPHASEDRVRNHLLEGDIFSVTFSNHLLKQRSLIEWYIDLDPALKEADARKTLLALTQEKARNAGKRALSLNYESSDEENYPRRKKPKMDHTRPDDVSMRENESEEEFYEDGGMGDEDDKSDDDQGESICIFCDDGGFLLCCDGPCLRSFHPRLEDGTNNCKTLGYRNGTNLNELKNNWLCKNCEFKKHQCYVCGELGDSDEALGPRREVFVCDVASCGKFYHPWCIASKLKPTAEREALANGIRAGEESFTCPLHMCKECGKGEEKEDRDLNLAKCRRCPAAWHVKCLPRTLPLEGDEESDSEVRAWKIERQFIVYCTDHEILEDLKTPVRNHVKFPEATKENTHIKEKISGATKEKIHVNEKISEAIKIVEKPQKKVSTVGNERPIKRGKASSSAVSQKRRGSAGTAQPATQHTSKDATNRFVYDIVARSKQEITEESVIAKMVSIPNVYRYKKPGWMEHGKFDSILNGAKAAILKLKQTNNWEDAKLKCALDQVQAITTEEDRLKAFLAPTYGKRYTSFGRRFTKIEKLQKVVEALQPYIWDEDTIVDFSCGDNSFSRLLHDTLANTEKAKCQYKSFDIFTPKDTFGFERKDWFNVTKDECGPGDNLVVGLNPPSVFADKFVSHALAMDPRVLVLIVPPSLKKPLSDYGYDCILDDHTTMADKSFYLPGSVPGSNDESLEQGNNVALRLYIYGKRKFFGASNAEPSAANLSQKIRKSVNPSKPAKPTTPSDSTDILFIPRERLRDPKTVSARSQPMPNRMSGATGPRSQIEEGEFLPPPPAGPPPPHQPSIYLDRPQHRPPQVSIIHPHHHSESPPPRHFSDESNRLGPAFLPSGHFRGMPPPFDPRSLLRPPYPHPPPRPPYSHPFPPYVHPFPPRPHPGPHWPQNQQSYLAPSTSRDPIYPPGAQFQEHHGNDSGGWLEDEFRF